MPPQKTTQATKPDATTLAEGRMWFIVRNFSQSKSFPNRNSNCQICKRIKKTYRHLRSDSHSHSLSNLCGLRADSGKIVQRMRKSVKLQQITKKIENCGNCGNWGNWGNCRKMGYQFYFPSEQLQYASNAVRILEK